MAAEEQKAGKWINVGDGNYVCSECGCDPIVYIDTRRKLDALTDLSTGFCPCCRAKMEVKEWKD